MTAPFSWIRPEPHGIHVVDTGFHRPRFDAAYLSNPKPTYPMLSRRAGEEGRVMLRVMVEVSGTPSKVEIEKSSGFPRLDEAALDAVKRWKFVPARRGTEAIAESVVVPLSFKLPR